VFVRGASDVAGLLRKGLWLGGRWHSVRKFEAVQPDRKKSGWVWMREWMEKEGKERDEKGRKAWLEMQSITEQLRVLRKSAEKVEDGEKKKKFEGFGGMGVGSFGSFGGFKKEEREIKPVKGLVLRKDKDKGKEAKFESEAEAFFGGSSSGAFGDKAGPPIASGSTVSPEAKKFEADKAWQREFGYRP